MILKYIGLNKLTVKTTAIVSIVIGVLFTIYAYTNVRKHPTVQNQEQKLSFVKKLELYAIRMLHYVVSFFVLIYPFVTKISRTNDFIYVICFVLLVIHRIILSECIVAIKEKQILDPNYVIGSNVNYEPWLFLLYNSTTFYEISRCLGYICTLIVLIRICY